MPEQDILSERKCNVGCGTVRALLIVSLVLACCGPPRGKVVEPAPTVEATTPTALHRPFSTLDFGTGEWELEIRIARDDVESLPQSLAEKRRFWTRDRQWLQSAANAWAFRVTGGDLGTAASSIVLRQGGQIAYEGGIVIDEHQIGLQNRNHGWITAESYQAVLSAIEKLSSE